MKIEELILEFSETKLPTSKWTHRAHIKVAIWHNWHHDPKEAFRLVKEKIIAYNEFIGTKNTTSSGYHETLSQFWMIVSKNFLNGTDFPTVEFACTSFLKSAMAQKEFPLKYYSKDVLFSKKARKRWINGDILKVKYSAEITIRTALKKDARRISYLIQKNADFVQENNYNPEQIRVWKKQNKISDILKNIVNRTMFCAFQNGLLVGTIGIENNSLVGLYISHTKRGQGLGYKLLAFLENYAVKNGIKELKLTATPNGYGFYLKHGFSPFGKIDLYYDGVKFIETRMKKSYYEKNLLQ